MAVADLCAAPGSKTTQVLDLMHRAADGPTSGPDPTSFPTGFVVANEFDAKRARLFLSGRVRRLTTPCCAVTVGGAQSLPLEAFGEQFDRVLAVSPPSPLPPLLPLPPFPT